MNSPTQSMLWDLKIKTHTIPDFFFYDGNTESHKRLFGLTLGHTDVLAYGNDIVLIKLNDFYVLIHTRLLKFQHVWNRPCLCVFTATKQIRFIIEMISQNTRQKERGIEILIIISSLQIYIYIYIHVYM